MTSSSLLKPGLVSITFRSLTVDEIICLCAANGLVGIEWGGDVHLPPGDIRSALALGEQTREAGLSVSAYGSYFRVATARERKHTFAENLEATVALGAPIIRVWVGDCDSEDATGDAWNAAFIELREICNEADQAGVQVGMEFHSGTLNNTPAASRRIIEAVGASNLSTFWQTTNRATDDCSLASIREMRDWISNVHVFNWHSGYADQTPLADGSERWATFLNELRTLPGERFLGLEFVKDGKTDQLKQDAATLVDWLHPR